MQRIEDLTTVFPNAAEDVRGFEVLSAEGAGVGHVTAVFLDTHQRKVRFLEVGGPTGNPVLVPVDAITGVQDRHIHTEQPAERVLSSPRCEPSGADSQDCLEQVYRHYGYLPHWEADNIFPGYPRG